MNRLWLFLFSLFALSAPPLLAEPLYLSSTSTISSAVLTASKAPAIMTTEGHIAPADVQQLLTSDGADIVAGDQVTFTDDSQERHHWQCNARAVLDDTDTFLGTGLTEAGAASRAEANCNLHLHLACYVVSCTHFIRSYDIQLGEE